MPKPYEDFIDPSTPRIPIDVQELADKHGVDAGELESIMLEYTLFAEKEQIYNRLKKKKYVDIETALTKAQEGLEEEGILYKNVRCIDLFLLVQHRHDTLPAGDSNLIPVISLLAKVQKMLLVSELDYLVDGEEDILTILEQIQIEIKRIKAGKSGSKKRYNAILVMKLAMIHPNPSRNTWAESMSPFFDFCRDVFIALKADVSVSALSHLIERSVKVKQKSKII